MLNNLQVAREQTVIAISCEYAEGPLLEADWLEGVQYRSFWQMNGFEIRAWSSDIFDENTPVNLQELIPRPN